MRRWSWLALMLAAGCQGTPLDTRTPEEGTPPPTEPPATTPPTDSSDPSEPSDPTGPTDTASTPAAAKLTLPSHVSLPFWSAGQATAEAQLDLHNAGDLASEALVLSTSGPFEIRGDTSPVAGQTDRALTLVFTGDATTQGLHTGSVTITTDVAHEVTAAAVIGDPDLGTAVWTTDDWGSSTTVDLPSAPFAAGGSWSDPSVTIFVPHGLSTDGPLHGVTHLHGWYAELDRTVAAQALLEQASLSGRDAVLVVPQGPVNAPSGDFGQLSDPGGHAALATDVLAVLYRDGWYADATLGEQVLTVHSGGYSATADILDHGGMPVRAAHLFDAMYGSQSTYEDYALSGGLLRSVYTTYGGTDGVNIALRGDLRALGIDVAEGFDEDTLHTTDVVIGHSPSSHDAVVSDRLGYARWLVESGLPPHDLAPPELLYAIEDAGQVRAGWRVDRGSADRWVTIEGSTDGVTWQALDSDDDGEVVVAPHAYLRAVADSALTSEPSDIYGATGTRWLVVDGFDRVLGGSYTRPTHDFGGRVGAALGEGFSTASNEAVVGGRVDLSQFDGVVWLLGDESTADDTFDADEQAILESWVDGGGHLIVSGAEVGFATDGHFLDNVLQTRFVSDSAGTDMAAGYTFGAVYPEDWPDVLAGDTELWTYATGGGAAVGHGRQIVVVGFGLENLADTDLAPALAELTDWLDLP